MTEERERRIDAIEMADAIVQAWELSPHQFDVTYDHQLQMALIAARALVAIANAPAPLDRLQGEDVGV